MTSLRPDVLRRMVADWIERMTLTLTLTYFLGIFLHYVHIVTISAFVNDGYGLDMKRVIGFSIVWPLMTCWYFWELVLKGDDEDA